MDNLFIFFLSNLGLKDESDNLIIDFHKKIYNALLSSIISSIHKDANALTYQLVQNFNEQQNRVEFENILKSFAFNLNLKIHFDATEQKVSKNEYLKKLMENNEADNYVLECLESSESIIKFFRNKIDISHSRINELEKEIKKYILQMNIYITSKLDRLIESELYEKNLTEPIKLSQTSATLLKHIIKSAVIEYRSEFPSKKIGAKQLCGKINAMFSFNWQRATFERHCQEKQIDWNKIANSKLLKPQKSKQ